MHLPAPTRFDSPRQSDHWSVCHRSVCHGVVRARCVVIGVICLLSFTDAMVVPAWCQRASASDDVSELIEQLGDQSFAIRVRAKEKLQQMGLEAFDELQSAQFHPDSEVVSAARFLINSLMVSWSKESDPAEVRASLHEYGAQDTDDRGSRIARIAKLPDRQGAEALARLTRYEPDLALSRKASLALMQQPLDSDLSKCQHLAEMILDVLKDSDRQAAQWLRVYAEDLQTQSYSVQAWRALLKKQRHEIDASASQQASRASVLALVRTCAQRAKALNQRDEAIKLSVENLDLIPPTTRDLVEACNWATDIKLHEFVLQLRDKNKRMFDTDERLLYGAAEALLVGGEKDEAQALAAKALANRPFPKDEEEKEKLTQNESDTLAALHLSLAEELLSRGLFDWAEAEYRCILDGVELTSVTGANTRHSLADMLGELLRNQDAIDVLRPIVDRARKDGVLRDMFNQNRVALEYMKSQLEFHQAIIAKNEGDAEKSRQKLKLSYDMYRSNVDVLIEMYRTDGDSDWKRMVNRLVTTQSNTSKARIKNLENQAPMLPQGFDTSRELSRLLNEYAWLVSNTTGDYDQALQASQRSLELTPDDAAKIDTCARCFFTLGRLDEALKMQQRALELMPHSPPMVRQLEMIQNAIEKKRQPAEDER